MLAAIVDDDDDVEQVLRSAHRKSFGRSSLGSRGKDSSHSKKSPYRDPEKQLRLAQMYSKIIQMSTENKINDKNSWSLELIDHMGDLIREDSSNHGEKGVNFQKASCTIEASVKIYTHRVDDTFNTSLRIMANLRSNIASTEEELDREDGTTDNENGKTSTRRVLKKGDTTKTIEKNIESLNAEKIESEHLADPLFQKMSQAFDEGGAKGMLMANMTICPTASTLSFHPSHLTDTDTEATDPVSQSQTWEAVDVFDLIHKAGITAGDLFHTPLCPTLDTYREKLGIPISVLDIPSPLPVRQVDAPADQQMDEVITQPVPTQPTQDRRASLLGDEMNLNFDQFLQDDDDDNDYGGGGYGGDDGDDDNSNSIPLDPRTASGKKILPNTPSSKIHWESVTASRRSSIGMIQDSDPHDHDHSAGDSGIPMASEVAVDSQSPVTGEPRTGSMESQFISTETDLTFFDIESFQKSNANAWVGARHWKYNTRARQPAGSREQVKNRDEEDSSEAVSPKKKSVKGRSKQTQVIDFIEELVSEDLFLPPKNPRTLLFTDAAKDKMIESASGFILPVDEKVQVQDLCRLFLRPTLKVAPPGLRHLISSSTVCQPTPARSPFSSAFSADEDMVWGEPGTCHKRGSSVRKSGQTKALADRLWDLNLNAEGDEEYDGDDGVWDDCDDDDGADQIPSEPERKGLEIRMAGMLQASRVVEKLRIGYATSAKRVNVRRLKTDMWRRLDSLRPPAGAPDPRGLPRQSLMFSPIPQDTLAENAQPAKTLKSSLNDNIQKLVNDGDSLSFQNLVSGIAAKQKQADVTISYYFICLLHLANEKTMKISGTDGRMDDLLIAKDI